MAEHIWSILSNKTMIDRTSNTLSLFEVLEQVNLTGSGPIKYEKGSEVVIPFNYSLTTLWIRSDSKKPEKAKSRITLLTPDNKTPYSQEIKIDLTNHKKRRNILDFQSLIIRGPGVYIYKIELEVKKGRGKAWKSVAKIPFDMIFDTQPDKPKSKKD